MKLGELNIDSLVDEISKTEFVGNNSIIQQIQNIWQTKMACRIYLFTDRRLLLSFHCSVPSEWANLAKKKKKSIAYVTLKALFTSKEDIGLLLSGNITYSWRSN